MTSRTRDRTTIKARIIQEVGALGFVAAEHVQPAVNPQVVAFDWQTPFIQVCDIGPTEYRYPATNQQGFTFPVGIAIYADLERPQWTLQGNGEMRGITWMQDQMMEWFYANHQLGGLVDRAWILSSQGAEIVEVQIPGGMESFLVALSVLEVKVDRAR